MRQARATTTMGYLTRTRVVGILTTVALLAIVACRSPTNAPPRDDASTVTTPKIGLDPELSRSPDATMNTKIGDTAAGHQSSGSDSQTPLLTIEYFDCAELDGKAPTILGDSDQEIPQNLAISSWAAGGPGGATWNADALHCRSWANTRCDTGELRWEIRVGTVLVVQKRTAIRSAGIQPGVAFKLTASDWGENFDQLPLNDPPPPYRTALIRARAILVCEAPIRTEPGLWPHREIVAERSIVAGFAGGE